MRIFLTGSHDFEWRWQISAFLGEHRIEVLNPTDAESDPDAIFTHFRMLEGCDGLIVCFSQPEQRRRLHTVLEISYASKLTKDIMVVDSLQRSKSWIHALPYSRHFPDLDCLQDYLCKTMAATLTRPRLFG
jgi:hypothetical protein